MATRLPAPDAILDDVTATIVRRFRPELIVLFGSRSRGDSGEDSDFDIMVVMDLPDTAARSSRESELYEAFRGRGWPIDFIVATPDELERRCDDVGTLEYVVTREGRVLYAAPGARRAKRVRERPRRPPESVSEWMARAENDLRAMELIAAAERAPHDVVCFHAHQGVEKLLKATLVAQHTPPPRHHWLETLLTHCPPALRENAAVADACSLLDRLWPRTRYPRLAAPTASDAAAAAAAARLVREAAVANLGS